MAEFMMLPPEVRQMIYHYLVNNTTGERMVCQLKNTRRSKNHAHRYSDLCSRLPEGIDHKSCAFGCCSIDPPYQSKPLYGLAVHHARVGSLVSLMQTGRIPHQEVEPILYQRLDLVVVDLFDESIGKSLEDAIRSNAISARARDMICDIRIDQSVGWESHHSGFRYRKALDCLADLLPSLRHLNLGIEVDTWQLKESSSLENQEIARALVQVYPWLSVTITCASRAAIEIDNTLSPSNDPDVEPPEDYRIRDVKFAVSEFEILRQALQDAKQERRQQVLVDERGSETAIN